MQFTDRDLEYIKDYSHLALTFNDFKQMAENDELSLTEKIGFPNAYRDGVESIIINDILKKLFKNEDTNKVILDIGSGCSNLTKLLIETVLKRNNKIILCDSEEMLSLIPNQDDVLKVSGKFPYNIDDFSSYKNQLDGIVIYSVLQHVIIEDSVYSFIDSALELLKPGGKLLLGDIPNLSKRNRFLMSEAGLKYHRNFTSSSTNPEVHFNELQKYKIDDSIIFSILNRYRNFGFETYLFNQDDRLPMANRREDILIVKH